MIDEYKVKPVNVTAMESLKDFLKRNINRNVIAHLNTNSLRNKFVSFIEQIMGNVDILMISETEFDKSFLSPQFLINGYTEPVKFDRNCQGGGMLYVREDFLNLLKKKWLLCYNRNKNNNLT